MNAKTMIATGLRILIFLLLLFPLVTLFLIPGGTVWSGGMWFWMILFLCFWIVWIVSATLSGEGPAETPTDSAFEENSSALQMISPSEQPALIRQLMHVRMATEENGVQIFRGRLKQSGDLAFETLSAQLTDQVVPLIQQDEQLGTAIILMPRAVEETVLERPSRVWLNWLLFGLTLVTTTWAGAMHQGVNLLEEPGRIAIGLPYSLGLMLILGLHELGHYFTAKYHGMDVTPPFFIPVPFALGTFGAFIQMKSPTRNRRALFDVAVAGPLAGLIVAIPALIIGLPNSQVFTPVAGSTPNLLDGTSVGSSLLFSLISKVVIGDQLQFGCTVQLSPLAFAGWLGLLVTALNLLPIGQLDGGHMARAMFGRRIGESISSLAMWSLFLLAIFVWPGLLFWAIIVFFIAGRSTPPLNDVTPISAARRALGYVTFLILALILIPLPRGLWETVGIHCPYL